jgi:hypothetical protein
VVVVVEVNTPRPQLLFSIHTQVFIIGSCSPKSPSNGSPNQEVLGQMHQKPTINRVTTDTRTITSPENKSISTKKSSYSTDREKHRHHQYDCHQKICER